MQNVRLDAISFDAGTQVRAAINEQVVADYAERMTEGVVFPPVTLFHDGNVYYMADGFHRALAGKRIGLVEIASEVTAGTKQDALWFALGANRERGLQMSERDKQHAVLLALQMWPNRLHKEIASHVGCSNSLVSKVSAKLNGESGANLTGRARVNQQKREAVVAAIQSGEKRAEKIAATAGVAESFVSKVRAEMGMQCFDRTKAGVTRRRTEVARMARDGFTTRQISAELGIGEERVSEIAKEDSIVIHADRAVGKTKRHDSNRIVAQIVIDADNLTAGVELIDFDDVDKSRIAEWLKSLQSSRDKLNAFIRRLTKEQQHGEAA